MKPVDLWLKNHNALRVQFIKNDIIRIRSNASGVFHESLTERYGLIQTEFTDPAVSTEALDDVVRFSSDDLQVDVALDDGSVSIRKQDAQVLVSRLTPFSAQADRGAGCEIDLDAGERFYGGGYRAGDTLELRGKILKNWCINVINYGPSPFVMSSRGWGILWNNTFRNFFDLGNRNPDKMVLWSEDGELDVFLFAGSYRRIVGLYTDITGKPALMPLFGYGLAHVCSECMNQYTLLDIAERFRREGIPCDTLSLEPDWMAKRYDLSIQKEWNKDKYHIDEWMPPEITFLHALKLKGFKLCLWTPCDYDLTHEAERQVARERPEQKREPLYETFTRIELFKDEYRDDHMEGAVRADPNTVPEEPWFNHFKKFFDKGVRGLKQDGCAGIVPHVDKLYANGRGDAEMHNLNQTLLAKQYHQGYREYAGNRPMIYTPSTFIGNQKWLATWAGDVGGGQFALTGLLNYSLQGHMNFTCDIDVKSLEGIHFGFFLGWAQYMNWASMCEPWHLSEDLKQAVKPMPALRYALLPYIYSSAYVGHCTGLSICRAMVLMYPDDPRTANLVNQYMFGDNLLVGAFAGQIYLPEGRWTDFWTGRTYGGNQEISDGYPADRGGYLFIRQGAIIPFWPEMNYVGEKPIETISLRIYPDGESSFTLYEDDGESFAYENGGFATTTITCAEQAGAVTVAIGKRNGSYAGMPEQRRYHVEIFAPRPQAVEPAAWFYDETLGAIVLDCDDQEGGTTIAIR